MNLAVVRNAEHGAHCGGRPRELVISNQIITQHQLSTMIFLIWEFLEKEGLDLLLAKNYRTAQGSTTLPEPGTCQELYSRVMSMSRHSRKTEGHVLGAAMMPFGFSFHLRIPLLLK
jgi:hypothetical protein